MSESQKTIVSEVISREGLTGLPDPGSWTAFLQDISVGLELPGSEKCCMEILFTDNEEIHKLNRDYRNKDQVTDVLSFIDGDILPDTEEIFLGSVVISVERAEEQAVEIGHTLEEELKFLVLHGLLHLLGYDHEADNGEMVAVQREIKEALPVHFQGVE